MPGSYLCTNFSHCAVEGYIDRSIVGDVVRDEPRDVGVLKGSVFAGGELSRGLPGHDL